MNAPQPVPQVTIDGPKTVELIRAFLILGQNCIKNEPLDARAWGTLLQNEGYLKHISPFVVSALRVQGPIHQIEELKILFQKKMSLAFLLRGAECCLVAASSLSLLSQLWTQHTNNVLIASQAAEIGKAVAGDIERIRTTNTKE